MLEYLFILVLLISEKKRSARRLACATEEAPIFTSGLLTSSAAAWYRVTIPDAKIDHPLLHTPDGALNVSLRILKEQG